MSVLLVGMSPELGLPIARRLIASGDQVRVVTDVEDDAPRYKEVGAFIARGRDADSDLIERAAQNVRTIVVETPVEDLRAVLDGAAFASVERVIVLGESLGLEVAEPLGAWEGDHLRLLIARRAGRLRRARTVSPEEVALAVDAADDLARAPEEVLDLMSAEGWEALGLAPPTEIKRGRERRAR